jgi:hypothetical protein
MFSYIVAGCSVVSSVRRVTDAIRNDRIMRSMIAAVFLVIVSTAVYASCPIGQREASNLCENLSECQCHNSVADNRRRREENLSEDTGPESNKRSAVIEGIRRFLRDTCLQMATGTINAGE